MHYIGLDPVLREKARKVSDPTTPKMRKLVKDLIDSMHYYSGVGIAANQVGSTHSVCVIQLPEDDIPTVLFNLEITRKEGSREVIEGCLSLPGYQGRIERAEKVWARGIDENGVLLRDLVVRWYLNADGIGTIDSFGNFTAGAQPGIYNDSIRAVVHQTTSSFPNKND